MQHTYYADTPEALEALMPSLFSHLEGRRKIALLGEMGAGKTTFVRAFCHFLGLETGVSSPTFALINEYALPSAEGEAPRLVRHMDLYRLQTLQEVLDIGLEDYLYDEHFCLIEWPQVADALLPADMARLEIRRVGEGDRREILLS